MKGKIFLLCLMTIIALACFSACGTVGATTEIKSEDETKIETCRIYECDYKSLDMNTKITTVLDDTEIILSGNIFRLLTDPLTVEDSDGNVLGYAGDAYGIIEQDDHGIYIGEVFDINMCGNFDLWGNSYELKDSEGNVVATAEFNMSNTGGSIVDADGNLVAEYSSSFVANDYTVTIYDNDVCSDMSLLMIIASYVSDYMADSNYLLGN